jgi:ATP-dependent helicase HepA
LVSIAGRRLRAVLNINRQSAILCGCHLAEPRILDAAFREGAAGLAGMVASVRVEVDTEYEKAEEQVAIDEIDARDETAAEFFSALDDWDADHAKWQKDVEGWLCDILGFSRDPSPSNPRLVRYQPEHRTLVPTDIVRTKFQPVMGRRGTYDRTTAVRSQVRLHRLGEGLIDALAEYVAWDDRGQAYAIWREDPEWDRAEGAEWVGFRFNLIYTADTGHAETVLSRFGGPDADGLALRRRADALFPPGVESIFIDASLQEVTDPVLLERLRRPYSRDRTGPVVDYNLTKQRRSIIETVVASDLWERLCRDARDTALHLTRVRPAFQSRCSRYAAVAQRQLAVKIEQLRLREHRDESDEAEKQIASRDLALEEALAEALLCGIRTPEVRVDSVGFVVLSGRAPIGGDTSSLDESEAGRA